MPHSKRQEDGKILVLQEMVNKMAYKRKSGKAKSGKVKLTAKQMKLPKALRDKILAAKRKGK